MPPTKQRTSTSAAVRKAAIEQAGLSLQELPEKPKDTWSLREAVSLLHDSITTALSRGYSHEEVSALLGEQGVSITASSLKRYLATARREKEGPKSKTKRARKPRTSKRGAATQAAQLSDAAAALENVDPTPSTIVGESAEEAAPSRKRRTRTTSSRTKASSKSEGASKTAAKTRSTSRTKTAPRSTSSRGRKKSDSAS
jgi:hypothetical protein